MSRRVRRFLIRDENSHHAIAAENAERVGNIRLNTIYFILLLLLIIIR